MQNQCIYFKGDRPCKPYWDKRLYEKEFVCSKNCKFYKETGKRILLIKIDALGDVLRSTPLAEGIKKKFPNSQLTWLVAEGGIPLLKNNPYIDRILPYTTETINGLMCEYFDTLINLDKDKKATFLANKIKAKEKKGFLLGLTGNPFPANKGAERLYGIALDNWGEKTKNTKSYQEMIFETAELPYNGEELLLDFEEDTNFLQKFKKKLSGKKIIGINTGCGAKYLYKRWGKNEIINLIHKLSPKKFQVLLLGGPDEIELNKEIEKKTKAINSGNNNSLIQFASLTKLCDIILTGDTLGLHMAIALKKPIIAFFGPTPSQEISFPIGKKLVGKVNCLNCYNQFPCLMEKEGKKNCMQTITPKEVFDCIIEILK